MFVVVLPLLDAAHVEGAAFRTLGVPNWHVLLAAISTEVDVVVAAGAVGVPRYKLLTFEGNGTVARCFQCCIDLATAGDELVELESEERLACTVLDGIGKQHELLQVV
ncbi:hypothetical protein D9M70_455420 [compost metagenome]